MVTDELDRFLTDLSSPAPVPGGGSVAALEVAMAAALLAMVSGLTLGRKKYESVQDDAARTGERAVALRDRAYTLVTDDIASYTRVAEAMTLPRGTDEEKAVRRARMQEALKGAALPPLETMKVARDTIDLAAELVRFGNRSAMSDVGTAVVSAVAGFEAARMNVETNVAAISDQSWVDQIRAEMQKIGTPTATAESVVRQVEAIVRGEDR